MAEKGTLHYDEKYFLWQKQVGEIGGWANLTKFAAYIKDSFNVLDFGCGGGYLLENIKCAQKAGIEINPSARQRGIEAGLTIYACTSEVPDNWADLIISNHALEHCPDPLQQLKDLYVKLRPGGRIVFVVPCESITSKWVPNDINRHLYTWSPMCFGNLFSEAGYIVERSDAYYHEWPRYYRQLIRFGGHRLFHILSKIKGFCDRRTSQVRLVAHRRQSNSCNS